MDVVPVVETAVFDKITKLPDVRRGTIAAGVNVLANPATEAACVACVGPRTVTVLFTPPARVRPLMVTIVSLVLVNVPNAIAPASVSYTHLTLPTKRIV